MDALENKIIEFVANERRKKPETVSIDARLQDDLKLEGDDAVALFQELERRFTTDCSSLWSNWENHFIPEGGPTWYLFWFACFFLAPDSP